MDDTSDSLSDVDSLGCLDQAFSLSDSGYLFEHSVSTIVTADTVAETPSPQVGRRRRHHSRADEDVQAAAVRLPTPVSPRGDGRREKSKRSVCLQAAERRVCLQAAERRVCLQAAVPPPSPHLSPRRSKRRKVNPSPRQKQENSAPAQTASFVPASSLDDNSFLNLWLDPCQPSTSSSSSSSYSISSSLFSTHGSAASASEGEDVSVDNKEVEIDPCGPTGAAAGQSYRDRRSPIDVGSLSFLTTEERAWLGAETTVEQSAPPPPEEILITSDDEDVAMVRFVQLEEDEGMARRMQEQFDREQAEPPSPSRSHQHHHHHHNHMEQFERDQREAQSSRSHQHLHQHDYHGNHHSHMLSMLSSTVWTPPWLDSVRVAAVAPFLYGENDGTSRQRSRGRGSRRGSRRAPPHLLDGSPGNDYEALLDFEERQGTVVGKKTLSKSEINRFPTKKYDSAQTAANTRCQICFCDYTCGEELRMLSCFHDYHVECIDKWLKVNATCPVCRCNMAEGESLAGQA